MIRLTRLNGHPITLNSELIKFVERAPDTVITLTNGEKLIVRETEDEIVHLIREFRCSLMRETSAIGGDPNATAGPPPKPGNAYSEGSHRG